MFKNLTSKFSNIFEKLRFRGKLTESDVRVAMREIKLALLEADVNYKVVNKFIDRITELSIGSSVLESLTPGQQVIKIVNDELGKLMGSETENRGIDVGSKFPCIVMVCGLQGSGKTTHSAKLGKYYLAKGHRPLLVACDIYRPAAIDQLKILGEKAGVDVFSEKGLLPIEIAKNGVKYAEDYGNDIVILDTAGRLHIDEELMEELVAIKSSVKVSEILLAIDSMTGQDAVNIAKVFNEKLVVDGVILTKLDGDGRGGAIISVLEVIGKPIKFVGIGEKIDDLELFKPDRMASRILGMGDVLTLIEKAGQKVDLKNAEKVAKKLKNCEFDMDDLLEQMNRINKLGSIRNIIGMIPGISNKIGDADFENGEKKLKKTKAIICSMTKKERKNPIIIDARRKRRIASGSGVEVFDVNQLLKQFEQMRKIFKQFGRRKGIMGKKMMPFM